MSKSTEKIQPSSEYTLGEAAEIVTVAEVRAIEAHFGGTFGVPTKDGGLKPLSTVVGLVWALERRKGLATGAAKLTEWADLDRMTLRELNGYFTEDPIEADDESPDSLEGKDAALAS